MRENVGQPAYLRVADDLRDRITNGEIPLGNPIPSTAELMSLYDVSSTVARAAVNELRIEGVVIGQPGKGVFVRRLPEPSTGEPQAGLMGELAALRSDLAAMNRRLARVEQAVLGDQAPRSGPRRARTGR